MNSFFSKYCYCLVMFLMWQPFKAAAQNEVLSLENCMHYALANNYTFKIQAVKIKQVEKTKAPKATRFLPQIDGSLNHQYTFGSAIDPNTNNRVTANFQYDNIDINARINLFNFAELWESKLQSKDIDIERIQTQLIEQEYMLSLIEKFYAALGTQEWLKIVREQLQNTELQVDRISKEVKSGLKPESDMYDIQVIYTQEKKTLIALEQEEINKKNELMQWINYKANAENTIQLLHTPPQQAIDSTTNMDQNIKVAVERNKKEKLEFERKQLLNNFLPKVTLGYSYGTFFSQQIANISSTSWNFGNQLSNNKNQFLGLGIQIPLFSRGDNMRLRNVKKLQIREQDLTIEKTKLEQTNILHNYYTKLQQYQEMVSILNEALNYAEKSLETTQTKYSYGKVDISAYKAAKNQLLSSSYDIINNNLSIYMSEQLLLLLK